MDGKCEHGGRAKGRVGEQMPVDEWARASRAKGRHGYGSSKALRRASTPPAKAFTSCESSAPVVFLSFGKHKGVPLTDVPIGYLKWVLRECDIKKSTRSAIEAAMLSVSH